MRICQINGPSAKKKGQQQAQERAARTCLQEESHGNFLKRTAKRTWDVEGVQESPLDDSSEDASEAM